MRDLFDSIRDRFELLLAREQRPDLGQVRLRPGQVAPALGWLKSNGFVQLTHMTAVDWLEDGQFQLTWLLTEPGVRSLMVDTRIDRDGATADSVHELWPQAVTYEQEIAEMFGIEFPGSPRVGVELILEDWKHDPPMRRDFDTVAFVREHIPERPGRETKDSKRWVGQQVGQEAFLDD